MATKKVSVNNKVVTCMGCGLKYNGSNFYKSKREEYQGTGKCPICKECLMKMIIDENGIVTEGGFKKVLSYLDLPFIPELFGNISQTSKLSTLIGDYIRRLNTRSDYKASDLRYADSIRYEMEFEQRTNAIKNMTNDEDRIFWGDGYTYEEYEFLKRYYEDLINTYDSSTPMLRNNFKNMARTQLNADKALVAGDAGSYDKFMKILSMLMGDSNIKPIQQTNRDTEDTLGCLIDWIEQTEPIPEASEEFKDVDGIMKYINLGFVKHFSRILGLTNDPLEADLLDLERMDEEAFYGTE